MDCAGGAERCECRARAGCTAFSALIIPIFPDVSQRGSAPAFRTDRMFGRQVDLYGPRTKIHRHDRPWTTKFRDDGLAVPMTFQTASPWGNERGLLLREGVHDVSA